MRSRTGPIRSIIKHRWRSGGVYDVTLECGHNATLIPYDAVRNGHIRCGKCETEAVHG